MGMLLTYREGYHGNVEPEAEEKPRKRRTRKAKPAPAPAPADQPTEGGSDSE